MENRYSIEVNVSLHYNITFSLEYLSQNMPSRHINFLGELYFVLTITT